MVYVEIRATVEDWRARLQRSVRNWPPQSRDSDKRLHHMATSHEDELSYLTLGELWRIVTAEENWPLFEDYFPPAQNVLARIDEIKTIRNRIAHCRRPHQNAKRGLNYS